MTAGTIARAALLCALAGLLAVLAVRLWQYGVSLAALYLVGKFVRRNG